MSEHSINIENILSKLSASLLNADQVAEILGNPLEYPTETIEIISIETALRYWNKEIEYITGDYIMNNIYSFWWTNDNYFAKYGFSDIAWECFDAFDSGEYRHPNDDTSIDPVDKYTRPMIKKFLLSQKLII
ncbi:hypothetical protein J7E24_10820 [Hymenobacter sp. ISL-91]|uniref:hypothetical protein n=1 Tax=Hymenobacter sp. ISL-91 TaxID=2819151 RepID=UPI001BE77214|nr:hypothetical protein [Hymenobacter sp. ISL-91]MBT2558277.1 hypothetical protein [Hymenobacter sp. ISL-91]